MALIFAIIWVLVGLVITSITDVVATSLTAITLSTEVNYYGAKVSFNQLWHDFLVLFSSSSIDRQKSSRL